MRMNSMRAGGASTVDGPTTAGTARVGPGAAASPADATEAEANSRKLKYNLKYEEWSKKKFDNRLVRLQ